MVGIARSPAMVQDRHDLPSTDEATWEDRRVRSISQFLKDREGVPTRAKVRRAEVDGPLSESFGHSIRRGPEFELKSRPGLTAEVGPGSCLMGEGMTPQGSKPVTVSECHDWNLTNHFSGDEQVIGDPERTELIQV